MIKWIKNLLCKIIGIKQCQCPEDMDEHIEYFTKSEEPDIPVLKNEDELKKHCDSHLRFRKSCPLCQELVS